MVCRCRTGDLLAMPRRRPCHAPSPRRARGQCAPPRQSRHARKLLASSSGRWRACASAGGGGTGGVAAGHSCKHQALVFRTCAVRCIGCPRTRMQIRSVQVVWHRHGGGAGGSALWEGGRGRGRMRGGELCRKCLRGARACPARPRPCPIPYQLPRRHSGRAWRPWHLGGKHGRGGRVRSLLHSSGGRDERSRGCRAKRAGECCDPRQAARVRCARAGVGSVGGERAGGAGARSARSSEARKSLFCGRSEEKVFIKCVAETPTATSFPRAPSRR